MWGVSVFTEPTDLNEALLDLINTSPTEESPPLPPRPRENTAVGITVCCDDKCLHGT